MAGPAAPTRPWTALDPLLATLWREVRGGDGALAVHQLRWDPGRLARATIEIRTRRGPAAVLVEVTDAGVERRPLTADPGLPGLRLAADPRRVAERLGALTGRPVSTCAVAPVSYRPGSRCVLRYDAVTAAGADRWYAKTLVGGVDRYVAASARLAASGRRVGLDRLVPEVVAAWPDADTVLTAAVPGRSLSRALEDLALPSADRLALARRLGVALAAVHAAGAEAAPAAATVDPATELAALWEHARVAWHADPVTAVALTGLLRELSSTAPARGRTVTGHGSFRAGQVVLAPTGLTVLDLDGVGPADPARDAGTATAHLVWQGVRGSIDPRLAERMAEAFLAGYADAGGRLDTASLGWWQAAGMARTAGRRYRSLAVAEWQHLPTLVGRAARAVERPAGVPRPAGLGGLLRPGRAGRTEAPDLLDRTRMTALLVPVLAPHAGGRRQVRVERAEVVATAPGRRVLMRLLVSGLERRWVPVMAKVYAQVERAGSTYRNLLALTEGPFAAPPGTGVPVPLGLLPDVGLLVYREAPGCPLDQVSGETADDGLRGAARWLRTLHTSRALLGRRVDLPHETHNAAAWAAEIACRAEDLRRPAELLATRLATAGAALPVPPAVTPTPVHKDFHPGHVLVDGTGAVTVVDLDEARMGDPAYDVAHMTAYLAVDPAAGPSAAARFSREYGDLPGPDAQARLAFWAALTHLKMAKQLLRGSGPHRPVPGRDAASLARESLERGLACLAG
jgi:aminoglycoside phosphotransferase (APT) family kinase protein